jgi:hypothetical protein
MLSPRSRAHLKYYILQASSLGSGPMDPSSLTCGRNTCKIKDKVPDLSIKDVRGTPVQIRGVIWISINESEAGK